VVWGDGVRATHVQCVGYRVGMLPRDETLLTHQLVASPSDTNRWQRRL